VITGNLLLGLIDMINLFPFIYSYEGLLPCLVSHRYSNLNCSIS